MSRDRESNAGPGRVRDRYKVTLYSGGKVVLEFETEDTLTILENGFFFQDPESHLRRYVSGSVFIEQIQQEQPVPSQAGMKPQPTFHHV